MDISGETTVKLEIPLGKDGSELLTTEELRKRLRSDGAATDDSKRVKVETSQNLYVDPTSPVNTNPSQQHVKQPQLAYLKQYQALLEQANHDYDLLASQSSSSSNNFPRSQELAGTSVSFWPGLGQVESVASADAIPMDVSDPANPLKPNPQPKNVKKTTHVIGNTHTDIPLEGDIFPSGFTGDQEMRHIVKELLVERFFIEVLQFQQVKTQHGKWVYVRKGHTLSPSSCLNQDYFDSRNAMIAHIFQDEELVRYFRQFNRANTVAAVQLEADIAQVKLLNQDSGQVFDEEVSKKKDEFSEDSDDSDSSEDDSNSDSEGMFSPSEFRTALETFFFERLGWRRDEENDLYVGPNVVYEMGSSLRGVDFCETVADLNNYLQAHKDLLREFFKFVDEYRKRQDDSQGGDSHGADENSQGREKEDQDQNESATPDNATVQVRTNEAGTVTKESAPLPGNLLLASEAASSESTLVLDVGASRKSRVDIEAVARRADDARLSASVTYRLECLRAFPSRLISHSKVDGITGATIDSYRETKAFSWADPCFENGSPVRYLLASIRMLCRSSYATRIDDQVTLREPPFFLAPMSLLTRAKLLHDLGKSAIAPLSTRKPLSASAQHHLWKSMQEFNRACFQRGKELYYCPVCYAWALLEFISVNKVGVWPGAVNPLDVLVQYGDFMGAAAMLFHRMEDLVHHLRAGCHGIVLGNQFQFLQRFALSTLVKTFCKYSNIPEVDFWEKGEQNLHMGIVNQLNFLVTKVELSVEPRKTCFPRATGAKRVWAVLSYVHNQSRKRDVLKVFYLALRGSTMVMSSDSDSDHRALLTSSEDSDVCHTTKTRSSKAPPQQHLQQVDEQQEDVEGTFATLETGRRTSIIVRGAKRHESDLDVENESSTSISSTFSSSSSSKSSSSTCSTKNKRKQTTRSASDKLKRNPKKDTEQLPSPSSVSSSGTVMAKEGKKKKKKKDPRDNDSDDGPRGSPQPRPQKKKKKKPLQDVADVAPSQAMKNVEAPTATQAKKKKKNPRVHIDQTVSTCTHSDSKSDKQQQARKRIKKKTNLKSNEPGTVLSDEQVEITSKRRNKKPLREPIARKKATKQHSSKSPEQGRQKDQPIQKQQHAKKDVRADTSQRRHDVITIIDEEELNSRNQLNHKVEDPDANSNQVETEQPLPLQQQQSQSRERVQQVEPSHWRHSPEKENTKPRGNESQALQKVENQEDDEDRVDVELQPVTQLPMENDSDDQIDAIENPDNNGFEDTSSSQDDTVAPPATQLSAGDSESDDHSNALDNQVTQKAKTDIEEGKKDEPQEQAEETLWKDSLVVSVSSKPDISLWKTIGDRSFTSFHLDGQLITMSFMDFLNEEALVCQKLLGGALPEQVGITSNKSFTRFLTWLLQSD